MDLVNEDVINNDDQSKKRKSKNNNLYQRTIIKSAKLTGLPHVSHSKQQVPATILKWWSPNEISQTSRHLKNIGLYSR